MNVILGVGGGIAAYKAAEVARGLTERGHRVQAVMTRAAQEFLRPLSLAALTGRKVITSLFPSAGEDALASAIEHIRVAEEGDLLLVAPATADLLAKFAHGVADDFLTTLYLAFTKPVVLAPAMNVNMWRHPATQQNLATLRGRGHVILEPEEGPLACGMVGPGRLAAPERIVETVCGLLTRRRDLEGECVLVTAGPTQEPLDPVRYLSNRSSGKMGYALAEAARDRGARVILISGPVALPPPAGVELVRVQTAGQMREAVLRRFAEATIVVKAAAVADYRPRTVAEHKHKKSGHPWVLELESTPDILAELGRQKGDRLLVGFAAETENLTEEARRKLVAKNCDLMVANRAVEAFGSEENQVVLLTRDGESIEVPRARKREVADRIFDELLALRRRAAAAP